jgi:hypothetical protein
MFKSINRRILPLLIIIVAGMLAAFRPVSREEHCNISLSPLRPGQTTSDVVSYECFATQAESLYAMSGGRIRISETATQAEIDAAIWNYNQSLPTSRQKSDSESKLAAVFLSSNQLLARSYDSINFGGSSLSIISCSTCENCTEGYQYLISDLSTWKDRFESAQVFENGCNYYNHYQLINYGQPVIDCGYPTACSGLGVLGNHVRSIKLYR